MSILRCLIVIVAGLALAVVACGSAAAQDDLAALNAQVDELYGQGKYAEATVIAKQVLAIVEKTQGPDHPDVGTSLNNIAVLYESQGRFAEAEPMIKRALRIREVALGSDHSAVGTSLNNLASLHQAQGRFAEAEPLYKRSLAIKERSLGPDHPDVGTSLNNLAGLYVRQGQFAEAEPVYKRSLTIREKALGPNDPVVGASLNNLAELHKAQGRFAEAEPLIKRSFTIFEKELGSDHPDVGKLLSNLAGLYDSLGRFSEAEPLYKRDLAIIEKALGAHHPDVGTSLNNLAALYQAQGRFAEAEPLYKRSLAIREKALGPGHPDVGASLNNLAFLYRFQGRRAEAELLYKRSLKISEMVLGLDHPDVGTWLNNLAGLYEVQDRFAEAEPLYNRSLATREKALGPDHPEVGTSLSNLAVLYFRQGDWARSADYWRRSAAIAVRRAQRGAVNAAPIASGRGGLDQLGGGFQGLVKVLHRLASDQPRDTATLAAEAFTIAQWTQSSQAAASLAQMAARGAKGDPGLAVMVRERQDLVAEWQRRDGARTAAVSRAPNKRDSAVEAVNVARLAEIDTRVGAIDTQLATEFPDYAALASPAPLTVEQVQADLRPDEALVLFLDTQKWDPVPEETFVWAITRTGARWARSTLGSTALAREVAALRCGLDATAWSGTACRDLTGGSFTASDREDGKPLPFDAERAHKLYASLFGGVADMITDKHLLLVPSGPLTQLPFQVLVTRPPNGAEFRKVAWLARDHALTVLPAVSSLKALRRVSKPSGASLPMIGFGNPLLDGPDYRSAGSAAEARKKQSCPETAMERVAKLAGLRGRLAPIATRGGVADVAEIKRADPLPETSDEVCAVARNLKADVREMRLGAFATERDIKALSASGVLARYRVLHFATHGIIAGQISGTSEPGLILTPPETATEEDDGYLSAGEIAALKLDADWVILSACNTAGGAGASGAEALSGLARAFFYAQARALLVSHWEVNSDATVKLITSSVEAMTKNKSIGRAEALRRAMLSMIDNGQPHEAHPTYWAPFVVVGEGAVTR